MNEGMRNVALLVWALCAMNNDAYASGNKMMIAEENAAQMPTVVYAVSKKSPGESDEVIVEQPADSGNPLGDPIPNRNRTVPEVIEDSSPAGNSENSAVQTQDQQQEAQPAPEFENSQQQLGRDFQNTLLEANGMVYDVQAYPEKDLKAIGNPSNPETIYSPNVNP